MDEISIKIKVKSYTTLQSLGDDLRKALEPFADDEEVVSLYNLTKEVGF